MKDGWKMLGIALAVIGAGLCLRPGGEGRVEPAKEGARLSAESSSWVSPARRRHGLGGTHPEDAAARRLAAARAALEAVGAMAEDRPDGENRRGAMARILKDLDTGTLVAVLEGLSKERVAGEWGSALVREWAGREPAAAMEWLRSRVSEVPPGHFAMAAGIWAQTDPEAARVWLAGLPEGEARERALESASVTAMDRDPLASLWMAMELADGEARRQRLVEGVGAWARRDTAGALEWVEQVQDETLWQAMTVQVATAIAGNDPEGAANLVATVPAGEQWDSAVTQIVSAWAERQPERAGEWVAQFEPGPLRANALAALAERWPGLDSEGAVAWGKERLAGEDRDAYFERLAGSLVVDPVGAARLAVEWMQPGERQDRAILAALDLWLAQSPAEAAAWAGSFPDGRLKEAARLKVAERSNAQSGAPRR